MLVLVLCFLRVAGPLDAPHPGVLGRREHRECGPHIPGDEGRPLQVKLERHPLIMSGLRMKGDCFAREFVRHSVAADVALGRTIEGVAVRSVSFDPPHRGALADVVSPGELVYDDARIGPRGGECQAARGRWPL